MYVIFKWGPGSYHCRLQVQDGYEEWNEVLFAEAMGNMIAAARTLNGVEITHNDIRILLPGNEFNKEIQCPSRS